MGESQSEAAVEFRAGTMQFDNKRKLIILVQFVGIHAHFGRTYIKAFMRSKRTVEAKLTLEI